MFFQISCNFRFHFFENTFFFDIKFFSKLSSLATQSDVYREVALPLVDAVFDGVNGCVLAYGQTGAGKTYTVVGEDVDVIRGTEQGAGKKF